MVGTTAGFPGRYLSLTSYRRDGTAVATPVWFVEHEGVLFIQTGAESFKVRRIMAKPSQARAGACDRGCNRLLYLVRQRCG